MQSAHQSPRESLCSQDQDAPYLSVVATARNDDHGGHLLGRMQVFVKRLGPSDAEVQRADDLRTGQLGLRGYIVARNDCLTDGPGFQPVIPHRPAPQTWRKAHANLDSLSAVSFP